MNMNVTKKRIQTNTNMNNEYSLKLKN